MECCREKHLLSATKYMGGARCLEKRHAVFLDHEEMRSPMHCTVKPIHRHSAGIFPDKMAMLSCNGVVGIVKNSNPTVSIGFSV